MKEDSRFHEESQAVQTHLGIVQSVIGRMASNSASNKAWCVALVSAIFVVSAEKGKPSYALLALTPTILFAALDAYYLALEGMFRQSYNDFVDKLHVGKVVRSDLYAVAPSGSLPKTAIKTVFSFSIWPFYLTLVITVLITKFIII